MLKPHTCERHAPVSAFQFSAFQIFLKWFAAPSSRLAPAAGVGNLPRMKFILSVVVYLLMAVVMAWGILAMIQPGGKPWILLAGFAVYAVLFSRIGCASEEH